MMPGHACLVLVFIFSHHVSSISFSGSPALSLRVISLFEEVDLHVLHVVSFQIHYPTLDQCSSLISAGFHGHNHRQDLVSASSSIYMNSDLILVPSHFQSWPPQ